LFVPCSSCGKENSATEEQPFCGKCNEAYHKDLEDDRKVRQDNVARSQDCSDDCDLHHCGGCGVHYEAWSGQVSNRCDECSMG